MHFSLQYDEWKAEYNALGGPSRAAEADPTGDTAVRLELLSRKMKAVEEACTRSDEYLAPWIFRAVTRGETYTAFQMEGVPFGRDMFYDRLRRYFYLLDKIRE